MFTNNWILAHPASWLPLAEGTGLAGGLQLSPGAWMTGHIHPVKVLGGRMGECGHGLSRLQESYSVARPST